MPLYFEPSHVRKTSWWQQRLWRARIAADDACDMLKEGDLVLLSGVSASERCLQCALRTPFHHVGICVWLEEELCVLESGIDGVGKWPIDVFLDASNWASVQRRHGLVAVRRLLVNGRAGALSIEQRTALRRYAIGMLGVGYASPMKSLKAFLGVKAKVRTSHRTARERVFCSELVAGCYIAMGLLPERIAAADYLPSDFAIASGRLPLRRDVALTSLTLVVFMDTGVLAIVSRLGVDESDVAMRRIYAQRVLAKWLAVVAKRRRERSLERVASARAADGRGEACGEACGASALALIKVPPEELSTLAAPGSAVGPETSHPQRSLLRWLIQLRRDFLRRKRQMRGRGTHGGGKTLQRLGGVQRATCDVEPSRASQPSTYEVGETSGPGGGHECCGFFCGPGWCGSDFVGEGSGRCNFNHPVARSHTPTGLIFNQPSDTDTCCQAHDQCCGTRADQSQCNNEMTSCFGLTGAVNVVNGGLDCTRGGLPMAAEVILAMTSVAVIGWCCGSPCPSTAELPYFTVWFVVAWYLAFLGMAAYVQLRGHTNPLRARMVTLMGLRSVMFPEEVKGGAALSDASGAEMNGVPPLDKASATPYPLTSAEDAEGPALRPYTTQTVWRLAWPWATPLFLALVTWTQVLLFWALPRQQALDALGLLTPDPRPSSDRLAATLLALNVSNATQFLEEDAALAAQSFAPIDATQLSQMEAARSAERWLSYLFVHSSATHLVNNVALQVGSGLCLEMLHGTMRTATVYMVSGVSAALAFTAVPRQSFTLLVGASSACFGLVGAQLGNCLLNWEEMPFRAWRIVLVLAYLVSYLLIGAIWPVANTAHAAHVVGLAQGFLVGLAVLRNFVVRPWQRQMQAGAAAAALLLLVILFACSAAGTGGTLSL